MNVPASPGRRTRATIGALALAVALSGCIAASTSADGNQPSATPTATRSGSALHLGMGYRYEDVSGGYAITFPGKFEVAPISGDPHGAMRASYSTTSDETAADGIFYVAGATTSTDVEIDRLQLEGTLYHMILSGGSMSEPRDVDLDGVPALTSEMTGPDNKYMTVAVGGEGHTYYQLVVIGGSSAQRQSFIDTFEKLD